MKKMTKAERIYEATRRECKDIITGTHGYSEGQRLSGLVTEEVVCMRTINAIMKLVDKEEHRIRLDEKLGVLSGEKLQLYINVNNMVRSTVENVKKSLKKFLDDLKPDSEYSKWLDERVEAMEAQEKAETVEQTEVEETAEIETAKPETAETDDSGFEYYSVETAEVSKEYMEFVAKKEKENERKFNNAISWANETLPIAEFVNIFVTEKMIKSSGGRLDGVKIGFSSYSFEGIVTGADRYDWKKYHVTVHNISGYKIEDNALKVIKHCFCGDFYI